MDEPSSNGFLDALRIIVLARGISVLDSHPTIIMEHPTFFSSFCASMELVSCSHNAKDLEELLLTLRSLLHNDQSRVQIFHAMGCLIVSYLMSLSRERPISLSLLKQAIRLDSRLVEARKLIDFGDALQTDATFEDGIRFQLGAKMTSLEAHITYRIIERYITSFNIINPKFILHCKRQGSVLLEAMSLAFRCWFRDPFDDSINKTCIKLLVTCFDIYNVGVYSVGQMNAVFRLLNFLYPLSWTIECPRSPFSNDEVVKILLDGCYSSRDVVTSTIESASLKNFRSYTFRQEFVRTYTNSTICAYVSFPPLSSYPHSSDELRAQKKQLLALAQECIFSKSALGQYRLLALGRELQATWGRMNRSTPVESILKYIFAIFQVDSRGFLASELSFVQHYLISSELYEESSRASPSCGPLESPTWIDLDSFVTMFNNISIFSATNMIASRRSATDARVRLQALVRQEAQLAVTLKDMVQLQYILRVNALYTVSNRYHVASAVKYWRNTNNVSSELLLLWMECQGITHQEVSEICEEFITFTGADLRHGRVDAMEYLTSLSSPTCAKVLRSKIGALFSLTRRWELLRLEKAMRSRRDEIEQLASLLAEEIMTGVMICMSGTMI